MNTSELVEKAVLEICEGVPTTELDPEKVEEIIYRTVVSLLVWERTVSK